MKKYSVIDDSYNYRGLFNHCMCHIDDDGSTVNIRRLDGEMYKNVFNLHNQCSSREATDIDLYEIESEESLVYLKIHATYTENALGSPWTTIVAVFNKESAKRKDEVIGSLKKEYGNFLVKEIEVKVEDSFLIAEAEAKGVVESWTDLEFDMETYELKYDEDFAPHPLSDEERAKITEIPF